MINYKTITAFFISLAISLTSFAQGTKASSQNAFQSGESLKYSIRYSFITGGYVTFSVRDSIYNNINSNYVELSARATGLVDALYKIRDTYVSFIHKETHQPVKSIRDIKEGSYKYYNEVTYDYKSEQNDSITIKSKKSGLVKVPADIQDILSAFYYARKFDFNDNLKTGEVLAYTTYFSDDIFPLRIKYIRTETINTDFGKMECYLFHPVTEVGRAFKTEEDMKIWISRDDNRIPVRVKVNLRVGSFICDLIEFKGLSNAFSCIRN